MTITHRTLCATVLVACVSLPAAAQSLAEASAEAKQVTHTWAVNPVPVYNPVLAAAATLAATPAPPEVTTPDPVTPTVRDQLYWKTRSRTLTTSRRDTATYLKAATLVERALDKQLHKNADDVTYLRDRVQRAVVEGQWNDAVKEVSRLKAAVTNDTRAAADLELEAHRAGVPPGWLVLE